MYLQYYGFTKIISKNVILELGQSIKNVPNGPFKILHLTTHLTKEYLLYQTIKVKLQFYRTK